MSYEPKHLKLWTMPDSYFGSVWPGHYVFFGQHRDSDALTRSNFISALKKIGGESETVTVIRESHWAVGWVEWIGIHQDDELALRKADEVMARYDGYPVVDEDHYSETEQEEAQEIWTNCYSDQNRLEYIRKHRDQFEFHSIKDIIANVRGRYFSGYASELLS